MPNHEGYVNHEVLQDLGNPGHLLIVSRWTSREHALRDYATTRVPEPRPRFLAHLAKDR